MRNTLSKLAGACVLALGLGSGAAMAVPVTGSITVSDGLDPASLGGVAVASILTGITHSTTDPAATSGCTGSFGVGVGGEATCGIAATMTDWDFAGPFGLIITVDGWTFTLSGVGAVTPIPLTCDAFGNCTDSLVVSGLAGTVSGNGFDPTSFFGSLSLTGACQESGPGTGVCGSDYSGGFTYTLTATGRPIEIPEPGTLALLGIAIAGLGALRRRA